MADLSDKDLQRLSAQILKSLSSGLGRQASTGYSGRGSKSSDDPATQTKAVTTQLKSSAEAFKKLSGLIKDQHKRLKFLNTDIGQYSDALNAASSFAKKHAKIGDKMLDAAESWRGSTTEFATYLKKHSKIANGFTSTLGQSTANAAMFGAAMIASHKQIEQGTDRYYKMIDGLASAVAPLNKGILKRAGLLNDITGEMRDGLSPDDFAKVRVALGAMEATIADSVTSLNFDSMQDFIDKAGKNLESAFGGPGGEKIKTAMIDLAYKMEAMGHSFNINHGGKKINLTDSSGGINADAYELLKKDASVLAQVVRQVHTSSSEASESIGLMNAEALKAGTVLNSWTSKIAESLPTISNFKRGLDKIATSAAIAENLSKAKSALGEMYNQIVDFNVSMTPATYMEVQLQSVRMGMSFEKTVKFMNENRRAMAIYGDGFQAHVSTMEGTFQKFGFNMEQAADLVAPLGEAAKFAGINVSDSKAMNNFIDQSMESWRNVASVTGITAESFLALNAQLLSSDEVQKSLLGMDVERAKNTAQQLIKTREQITLMGLSNEAAQDLMLTQRRASRESVMTRITASAKSGMLARSVGMSNEEAKRIEVLTRKHNLSAAEQLELAELDKKTMLKRDQRQQAADDRGDASSFTTQTLFDAITPDGARGDALEKAGALNTAERAGEKISASAAATASAAAKGNENVAALGNAVNTVTSILENSFTKSIMGAGLALIGLAYQAFQASMALRGMGGGGGMMDMLGGGGGMGRFGKFGKGSRIGRMARGLRLGSIKKMRGLRGLAGIGRGSVSGFGGGFGGGAVAKRGLRSGLRGGGMKFGGIKGAGIIGTVIGAGMLASDWSDINAAQASGDISEMEAVKEKGGAIGGIAGGALGGAAMGALVGSVVPVVGTAIGGIIGGAIGAMAGSKAGSTIAGAWNGDKESQKDLKDTLTTAWQYGTIPGMLSMATGKITDLAKPAMASSYARFAGTASALGIPGASMLPGVMAAGGPDAATVTKDVNSVASAEGVSSISNVQDLAAHTYLKQISQSLLDATELLTILADSMSDEDIEARLNKARNSRKGFQVPSVNNFLTGRS